MKYILVIGDGMADTNLSALSDKTPLEWLTLPSFNTLAGSACGLVRTVPKGVPAGSDTAILNIFGNDPRGCYTGRSALEAAGVGVRLKAGEVSFRLNLCAAENGILLSHNGGGVEGDEAETLVRDLVLDPGFSKAAEAVGLQITVSRMFRHIGVIPFAGEGEFRLTEPHNILGRPYAEHMPAGALSCELSFLMTVSHTVLDAHPINAVRRKRGDLPANILWPWGAARAVLLPSFQEKYGHGGAVVSAVPLVQGIAKLMSLPAPTVEGATGDLDTNYEGKTDALLNALKNGDDFACIHIEAPDEMSHAGSLEKKLEALRRIDTRVLQPMLTALPAIDPEFRILFLSDHPTLLTTRTHDGSPVPFALFDSRRPGSPRKFCEKEAAKSLYIENGDLLMPLLFEQG